MEMNLWLICGNLICKKKCGKKFFFFLLYKVVQKGELPKEREGLSMVCLFDRYIFLYGGWNGK